MANLRIKVDVVGFEAVYDTDPGGNPVFRGYRVALSAPVVSAEEAVQLVAVPPYDVVFELVSK